MAFYECIDKVKPFITIETVSGAICSFNDEYGGLPLKSCVSQISGYQEGSGTPSPSNVRPLHAFSSASLGVNTINQWDEQWEVGNINETTGQVQAGYKFISKNFIPCLPNTQYRKLGTLGVAPAYYGWLLFYYYDENHNFIGHDSQWTDDGVFTTPANCHFMKFRSYSNCSSYGNDISINHPSSDENYHAFNGAILTFGQDIYKGTIDWKRGVVTAKWGYIASYNGETLTGEWLCNKASYEVGTTPPTGSQVAYELATPIEIPLGGINILTQEGQNNIFADCGDTTVEYIKIN